MNNDDTPPPGLLPGLTFRAEQAGDEAFLFELYASTRQEELAAVGWDELARATFLKLQFQAQRQGYRSGFPQAEFWIILQHDQPVGRLVLNQAAGEIRLVDLALLPANQGQGIGTRLLEDLQGQAAQTGKPLRLRVLKGNRAVRLYQRLGFRCIDEADLYDTLEWRPEPG